MSEWQPIETAPKDGTLILVYEPVRQYAEAGIYMVSWDREYPYQPKTWCIVYSEQDEQGGCATVDWATYWMPLPEPPK